jgi:hypothetical protein
MLALFWKRDKLVNSVSLLFWGGGYYLLGCISLILNDPGTRIAFIWLPAGAAVSAFLITSQKKWLLLFISLLIFRLLLDLTFHHAFSVSLGLSVISLSNDMAIAWCTRYFSRNRDVFYKVVSWILSTIIFSALAALLGVTWLSLNNNLSLPEGIWIWWSANVTGTLFITPALVGLLGYQNGVERISRRISLLLIIAVLLATVFTFAITPEDIQSVALTYSVTCIPLILMTVTAVLCNNRLASVAFILFSSVVFWSSWDERGPFYIAQLTSEESIILAQCYLSGAALLIIFIRAQKRFSQTGFAESAIRDVAYSLDPQTGMLTWNPHAQSPFTTELSHITTRDDLLAHIPDDRQKAQMQARWQAVLDQRVVGEGPRFMLHLQGRNPIALREKNTLMVAGKDAVTIVGFWSEANDNLRRSVPKGES